MLRCPVSSKFLRVSRRKIAAETHRNPFNRLKETMEKLPIGQDPLKILKTSFKTKGQDRNPLERLFRIRAPLRK